jgi:dihydroorotate dehydrogenase electron transfer subunit
VRLLIGSDSGYAALIRAANELHQADASSPLLVLFGAADSFSFRPRPSTILVPRMLPGVIACVPVLEEFGIASRLATEAGLPGCYDGPVTELARLWLQSMEPGERAETSISVAGPDDVIAAAEELGRDLQLRVERLAA